VPPQGDCNTCPTRVTCQAHELGGAAGASVDIEDAGATACGGGREVKIEVPKEARGKGRRSLARNGAKPVPKPPT